MALDDTELEFEPEALRAIAAQAIERNTGARGLRSIIENIMMDVMFNVPSDESIQKSPSRKKRQKDLVNQNHLQ